MKLIGNILLSFFARTLLYILSAPLIFFSFVFALSGGDASHYWRLIAIVLDIVGNVIGGPVWNVIFFKRGAKPEVKFGGIITMSFVFGYNYDQGTLNKFGIAICEALEKIDPGHLKTAQNPTYLYTYHLYWHGLN